jgi:putative membrane protein
MPENTDDNRQITILLVIIGAVIIFSMGFGMMGFGSMMGGM